MKNTQNSLPDIINSTAPIKPHQLNWVGMENIAVPMSFPISSSEAVGITASANIFVSLDTGAKGIHMSRLYLDIQKRLANKLVSYDVVCGLLESVLIGQGSSSKNARIDLSFELPINRPALLSENQGYQVYEIKISQELVESSQTTTIDITIPYSSTCPCSASLARQLIANKIDMSFAGNELNKTELMQWLTDSNNDLATPHNQRSYAYIQVIIAKPMWPHLPTLIANIENSIGTPVQTAVKREDEQAFAKLNGKNLMFCEDAARKLDVFLRGLEYVNDYQFKVEHQESLHAHNAVVIHKKQKNSVA